MRSSIWPIVLVLEAGKVKAFGPLEEVWSSSVMHPWLPAEQQSTILSATVAAQHPQYAMTALALGTSCCGSTGSNVPQATPHGSAFRRRTFR